MIHLIRILVGKDDEFLMIFWCLINEIDWVLVAPWRSLQLNHLRLRQVLSKTLHKKGLILKQVFHSVLYLS